jgi:hypothetical protein
MNTFPRQSADREHGEGEQAWWASLALLVAGGSAPGDLRVHFLTQGKKKPRSYNQPLHWTAAKAHEDCNQSQRKVLEVF